MTRREIQHKIKLERWQVLVRACQESGDTVAGWCRKQGVSVSSYHYWEKVIRAMEANERDTNAMCAESREFVELARADPVKERQIVMTLRIGQVEADIYEDASREMIKTICEVLKGC